MGYQPIAHTAIQYVDGSGDPYSGAVLKGYAAGTSSTILMANDTAGSVTVTSAALNANGYPEISGTIIIPHFDESYKIALYPSQAAADSDTGEIWMIDNNALGLSFGEGTVLITSNTVLTSSEHANKQINVTGTTTLTLPAIASVSNAFIATIFNAGTGVVTIDGNSIETINGATTWTIPPNGNGMLVGGDTTWQFNGNMGTVQSLAAGDILYADANTQISRLAKGDDLQSLVLDSGLPVWRDVIGALVDTQTFTAGGTWTKPSGTTKVNVEVVAGSGGGGASNANAGGAGGASSFGAHCTATGGAGGVGGNAIHQGRGTDGVGSSGDYNGILLQGGDAGYDYKGGSTWDFGQHGGAGGYSRKYITSGLGATETITVGDAGAAGAAGTVAGDAGQDGYVIVTSYR